jgi:hypothetical protein
MTWVRGRRGFERIERRPVQPRLPHTNVGHFPKRIKLILTELKVSYRPCYQDRKQLLGGDWLLYGACAQGVARCCALGCTSAETTMTGAGGTRAR